MNYIGILIAIVFTLIHFSSEKFRVKFFTVRQFTSFVGGISIAYVFFHLIPIAREHEEQVKETLNLSADSASHVLYGSMLVGLVIVYILEQLLENTASGLKNGDKYPNIGIFWAHLGTYSLYNLVTGILLSGERFEADMTAVIYLVAIGFHFLTNDWVLREHFNEEFQHHGRYLLGASILVGLGIGLVIPLTRIVTALLEASIAGGLILNTIKDELPTFKKDGVSSFVLGVIIYSGLLISF